jgi:hypothetical protein
MILIHDAAMTEQISQIQKFNVACHSQPFS